MNYTEFWSLIQDNAYKKAWLHSDDRGIWTLRGNLDITIRLQRPKGEQNFKQCKEPWATKLADSNADIYEYEVYCGASFIESFYLVAVDGGRACVPFPDLKTMQARRQDYVFAQCVDFQDRLEDYMERCGITVAP